VRSPDRLVIVAWSVAILSTWLVGQGGAADDATARLATQQKASASKEAPLAQNRQLAGDVFVVTRGGTNYKLGLVTVSALAEGVLQKHLARKTRESELEVSKLQPEIDSQTMARDAAEARAAELLQIYFGDVGNQARKAASDEAKTKRAQVGAKLSELILHQNYLKSAQFFYEGLPAAISTAKTDADGKFTIQIPRRRRVAIAARSSRQIGETNEEYFWIVWVNAQTKRVMLSNDNMMGQGSPESAWRE
jgi:hypothetical protein